MKLIKNENHGSLQLLIDYDGLLIPLEKRIGKIDFSWLGQSLVAAVRRYGEMSQARAYARWNRRRYGNAASLLSRTGIEPVLIRAEAKNQADVEIIEHLRASVPYLTNSFW